jgi:eukaryotic-like serine/threonine-protein kinase
MKHFCWMVAPLLLNLSAFAGEDAMFRANPQHSGIYDAGGVLHFSNIKWKFHTDGSVISSPAIANGIVYVGSTDHNLYAVDVERGTLRWKFKTGSRVTSSPAVSGGLVYFESYDGNFYAVDAAKETAGERRFAGKHLHGAFPVTETMPDPFDFYLSSPALWNGAVYFGSGDGNVYALDAVSGQLR